jgi:neurotransmitter:Na+ symporter, NSS family
MKEIKREIFTSRLGFILVAAGCAIGLGNVWRFPYITGIYGGGCFVLLYLFFLLIMGIPLLIMELAVGRASRRSLALSFETLQRQGKHWNLNKYWMLSGNYFLLSFYTVVTGWVLYYLWRVATTDNTSITAEIAKNQFTQMLSSPGIMSVATFIAIAISVIVCAFGVRKGVESITKYLMMILFIFLIILAINSVSLPNAADGLNYYLGLDWPRLKSAGVIDAIFAAMGQAFFTLGIGVGSIQIFGSYTERNKSLTNEAFWITFVDTMVAVLAGFIIFPACLSFGINPDGGPKLLFITLVNIFGNIEYGRFWGVLFFALMSLASLTTLIAVFENVIAMTMELFKIKRQMSVITNLVIVSIISIPCILGFNYWNDIQPLGLNTTILDVEDFILSYNILPLGALVYILFCTRRSGWGFERFVDEVDSGGGLRFPRMLKGYVTYILPVMIIFIYILGYLQKLDVL